MFRLAWSALVLLPLLSVLSAPVCGQSPRPADPGRDPENLGGISLEPDKETLTAVTSQIEAARQAIKGKKWRDATSLLQKLLDRPDDVSIAVPRMGPGGKPIREFVSVRAEAGRMLAELPPEARASYEREYGPKAAQALKNAEGDPKALALIMHRYFYTEAGAAATEQLATHLLDRGEFSTAALCFEKLMRRSGPEKLAPLTLFKAAVAFHHVSNKSNEDRAWRALEGKTRQLKLGNGKSYSIKELREWGHKRPTLGRNRQLSDWLDP
ncbi:MAG TPA: hypothetical protein VKD72_23345 [Gemmataceae bacterium]|nr:hypothetical protein [Gemmataceae bacterium]